MSDTYSLNCVECRKQIWIGQSPLTGKTQYNHNFYFREIKIMRKLGRFLFRHQCHRLIYSMDGGGNRIMTGELVTVEEAARILKVRRETIRRYILYGHLQALTLPGGDYRLLERDIQKLLSRPDQKKG